MEEALETRKTLGREETHEREGRHRGEKEDRRNT